MSMETGSTENLKNEMLALIRSFHAKGWSPATSTNYSFRNPGQDNYTISRSGIDKSMFGLDDFMVVDAKGEPLKEYQQFKPSAETLLHTMLYRNPNVQAVVHTHSLASTVISLRYQSQKAVKLAGFELLKALEGINTHQTEILVPVFNNSQDMAALSAEIEGQSPASMHGFLLSGHGLYTWGNSIAAARRHTEALEFMFECLNMDRHQPVLNIKSVQSWQS